VLLGKEMVMRRHVRGLGAILFFTTTPVHASFHALGRLLYFDS
jgi:hypothetical protein